MLDNAAFARVIREFLRDPNAAGNLRAFYELAFHLTRSYIRILRVRGWRLPVEDFSSETAIDDLTIDVLALLFASKPGHPCYIITDYLSPRCQASTSDEEVVTLAKAMISGHVRQELTDLVWGRRPEQGRVRRRIREITEGDGYVSFEESGTVLVRWKHAEHGQREEARVIDDGELHTVVLESASSHSQMPERCRGVFQSLDGMEWLRNAIPRYRLISAFCRVLDELAQTTMPESSSPRVDYVRNRARDLARQAIDETIRSEFTVFEFKKGFDDAMRGKYILALTRLVDDLIAHGEHDLLPRYLKEQLGEESEDSYLGTHKHSWETMVKRCLARLRDLLAAEGLEPE